MSSLVSTLILGDPLVIMLVTLETLVRLLTRETESMIEDADSMIPMQSEKEKELIQKRKMKTIVETNKDIRI